ncbi:Ankyrin repeat-containing domain superfamily [Arabidopsis thaliana x Arabidopsis arenosa]|uniref:Ankyrin repeat-containing domain superfamily n=1 Tax=Arabidopsis thaliana x Arabidopsis arenosa TaxID=1240361 RepID=A0A8T1Y7I9_9BRAS|nr:Ankyrin repeat-containing domain superfamily [Arabidopsis thaliana x Arabidopsis arenosa]
MFSRTKMEIRTALYYAIEGRYLKMATCLVNANKDAPFLENNKGISSLYEAVSAGCEYIPLVKAILETIGNEDSRVRKSNLDSKLQGNKDLAHVALRAKSIGVYLMLFLMSTQLL